MLGARCANGSLVNRYGYRNRPSATLDLLDQLLALPGCMPISCPMLVWLRSRSNMGSRCIRPMETLHDFQNCVGQIRLVLNEENPVMDGACASASGSDPKSPK